MTSRTKQVINKVLNEQSSKVKGRSKTPVLLSPRKQDCENRLTTKLARKIVREQEAPVDFPFREVWDECAPVNVSASKSMAFFDPLLGTTKRRKRRKDR